MSLPLVIAIQSLQRIQFYLEFELEQFAFETALTVREDAVAVGEPASLTDSDSTRLVRRKAAWILGKTTFFPKNPQESGFGRCPQAAPEG